MAAINADALKAAQIAGKQLGVDPQIIYAQFAFETGNFTNSGSKNYNYGGVMYPGTHNQRTYNSPDDFAQSYINTLSGNFPNTLGAGNSIGLFVNGLATGRNGYIYFGKGISTSDYYKGVESRYNQIWGGGAGTGPDYTKVRPEIGNGSTSSPEATQEGTWYGRMAANGGLALFGALLIVGALWSVSVQAKQAVQ